MVTLALRGLDSLDLQLKRLILLRHYWIAPGCVFLATIISTLATGLKFTPDYVIPTWGPTLGSITVLAAMLGGGYGILYGFWTLVLAGIARLRGKAPMNPKRILAGVILAHAPNLVVMWLGLIIPQYLGFDRAALVDYPATSVTFLLRDAGVNPLVIHMLNRVELFNLLSLALLSLLLRWLAGLGVGSALLISATIDLGIQALVVRRLVLWLPTAG